MRVEKPNTPPKSWRDVIKIHPACGLFPMMTLDELKTLGDDIKRNGMSSPIVWWCEREADVGKTPAPEYYLLDGRNRLDAMEMVGIKLFDANGKSPAFYSWVWEEVRYGEGVPQTNAITGDIAVERTDPYQYVMSANVHRRHLTAERKRDLIAKVLKAQPEKSNRTIAKQTKSDHKTVGAVRDKLEARGEIPHVSTVEDTKGRQQSTHKARRTVDDRALSDLTEELQSWVKYDRQRDAEPYLAGIMSGYARVPDQVRLKALATVVTAFRKSVTENEQRLERARNRLAMLERSQAVMTDGLDIPDILKRTPATVEPDTHA